MDTEILQLHEFFVEGGNQEKSHVLLHITEPSTPAEQTKGYFFAVSEIKNGSSQFIAEFQSLVDRIENEYYETVGTPNAEVLEQILEKINREHRLVSLGAGTLHCVVGIVYHSEIVLSFHGQPLTLLCYQNKTGAYQRLDLITGGESDDGDSDQLFSQLVQGKISPRDFLCLASPEVNTYFHPDRLQKIITTRGARLSAEHLRRSLGELKNGSSFGGLIVHLAKPTEATLEIKKHRPQSGDSAKSLAHFFSTERETEQTLSLSMWPRITEKWKVQLAELSQKISTKLDAKNPTVIQSGPTPSAHITSAHFRPHQRAAHEPTRRDRAVAALPVIGRGALWVATMVGRLLVMVGAVLGSILIWCGRNLGMLFLAATNYRGRRKLILDNWSREWTNFWENINHLPRTTKILLSASSILVICFAGSIVYLRSAQSSATARAAEETILLDIKQKKDTAESALLYKDEATALAELSTAKNLLGQVPCERKDRQATCQELSQSLEALLLNLRKIVSTPAVSIATWNPELSFAGLAKIENKLVAYSPTTQKVGVFDILSKEQREISAPAANFSQAAVPKENDYILFGTTAGSFFFYRPSEDSFKPATLGSGLPATISGFIIYNRRLYVIDQTGQRILRLDAIKDGFARPQEWTKAPVEPLAKGNSLSIDGDLFVLTSEGQIIKLTSGVAVPFPLANIDPQLTEGKKLWTYTDLAYLYILDTAGKRLIVFSKDGHLHKQITSPDFVSPTDMVVDEQKRTAYILDNNRILEIKLAL